ncbi:hypothetical protein IA539_08870 [Gordonia sp. zg691]|uniref:hypothetical protein n=1 Tax=Gordonia jinghuaiqii TaxID=2758710 RepID=UPI00166282AC|nr:hypothetical protein [Gordonia jinghuaiqii]MBD0861324.1 hypothetical protein [Gordonia jinghuaiqii]
MTTARTARRTRSTARRETTPTTPDISTMTPAQKARYALAVHESAHAVVATVLGHGVTTVDFDDDTRTGRCAVIQRFGGRPSADIAYAGPYAEAYLRHGGPPTSALLRHLLSSAGREDYAMMTAAGDTRPAEGPRLVASCWASITYLANHLQVNGSATQADVDRALRLPRDDEDGRSHALATIRSGSVPGSFTVVAPLP